jgi:hypothetical protein
VFRRRRIRCQQKQILSADWRKAEGPTLASARSFHERLGPKGFKSVSDPPSAEHLNTAGQCIYSDPLWGEPKPGPLGPDLYSTKGNLVLPAVGGQRKLAMA